MSYRYSLTRAASERCDADVALAKRIVDCATANCANRNWAASATTAAATKESFMELPPCERDGNTSCSGRRPGRIPVEQPGTVVPHSSSVRRCGPLSLCGPVSYDARLRKNTYVGHGGNRRYDRKDEKSES